MPKNIVILFDGTWNDSITRSTDTNIHMLDMMISPQNQGKEYFPGVGENVGWINRRLWGAVGKGVFETARRGWRFIARNYVDGDKIYVFGFSRGAYAARHLAGMVVRYGVKGYQGNIEIGFREYIKNCGTPCEVKKHTVHFLGLFDCVPANYLYLLRDRSFHLNSHILEDGILNFRHAVSTLERRYSFRPILFEKGKQETFAQHWFPGYHSDVGGHKDNSRGLASFSLWWMIREAYGLGLDFDVVDCRYHHFGNGIPVVQNIDLEDKPICSDYFTTKLGIRWDRAKRESTVIPDKTPELYELTKCPRCGKEMFDIPFTDDERKRLIELGLL